MSRLQFCFFASGAAGLVYQVVWTKQLGLLFGYSAHAVATVLAVRFAGAGVSALGDSDKATRALEKGRRIFPQDRLLRDFALR